MTPPKLSLADAVVQWPAARSPGLMDRIRAQRELVKAKLPPGDWPTLELERYALGVGSQETFCYLMEFGTPDLGSIAGGAAHKHLIYKRSDTGAWWFNRRFDTVEEAWSQVRAGFVRAFDLAASGQVADVGVEPLNWAPALTAKAVCTYFPGLIVSVYSHAAKQHFSELLGGDSQVSAGAAGSAELLEQARSHPELADMDPDEISHFLYWWADPRESRRVVKIAPGPDAKYWDECRDGGFICVGWDEVPNLSDFDAKDEFRTRFNEAYHGTYGSEAKLSAKANELWTLRELEPGDLIIANRGQSHVLALGTVKDPGYEYLADRPEWRHAVRVDWDTSFEQDIDPIRSWGMATVAKVPFTVLHRIQGHRKPSSEQPPSGSPPEEEPMLQIPVEPLLEEIDDALGRKGQVILYGPPGTGKTYHSNRFAAWWLRKRQGRADATSVLADRAALAGADRDLTSSRVQRRTWWMVATPSEWAWEQLFKDGHVDYRYGRIRANYGTLRPGDLVVGYQANPDKRIVALGRVVEGLHEVGNELRVTLEPVARVPNGPGYDELTRDAVLSTSEAIRNRNQGTLFKLTVDEADYLLSLLAERNPGLPVFDADDGDVGHLTRVTFHPSYTYEDFVEGYKPVDTGSGALVLRLMDGVFKRVCRTAAARPDETFLLLIDEINRGNIPKIFGELITLLEQDKRGMAVILPQSREPFAVPPNVFVVGTMNTADRSIKLLDAALRRRFAFIELMPDPEVLRGGIVDGLDLEVFLEELNRRIAAVEGREKQIGHSYLLRSDGQPVGNAEELSRRFRHEILPLLQEYAYEDYAELEAYVGKGLVDAKELRLRASTLSDPALLVAALRDSFMGNGPEAETESVG
jgi:5-methylcytosine-specific restriction protein B